MKLKEEVELRKFTPGITEYPGHWDRWVRKHNALITALVRAVEERHAKVAGQEEGYIIKENGKRVCYGCGNAIAAAILEKYKVRRKEGK